MADRTHWIKESVSGTVEWQNTKESTFEETYKALGFASVEEVMSEAATYLGGTAPGGGKNFRCVNYSLSSLGGDAFDVTLHYESTGDDDGGGGGGDGGGGTPMRRSRQFDTSGATTHLNVGLEEKRFGQNAPNMKNAIGVDGDSIAGVDVTIPSLSWSETYEIPGAYVTNGYVNTLADLTGSTNADGFRGFAAGEVLFLGCSGQHTWDSERGDGPWVLSYKFAASKNNNNIVLGDIAGINKEGHEYLWAYYGSEVAQNTVFRTPKWVYVTRVYPKKSFASLGLG